MYMEDKNNILNINYKDMFIPKYKYDKLKYNLISIKRILCCDGIVDEKTQLALIKATLNDFDKDTTNNESNNAADDPEEKGYTYVEILEAAYKDKEEEIELAWKASQLHHTTTDKSEDEDDNEDDLK